MFVAKFFRKEHKLGSYKGKTILEAKRPLLIFSLDVEFYLAFHVEGKKTFFDITLRATFRLLRGCWKMKFFVNFFVKPTVFATIKNFIIDQI